MREHKNISKPVYDLYRVINIRLFRQSNAGLLKTMEVVKMENEYEDRFQGLCLGNTYEEEYGNEVDDNGY